MLGQLYHKSVCLSKRSSQSYSLGANHETDLQRIVGLVAENIVAIDAIQVGFAADANFESQ